MSAYRYFFTTIRFDNEKTQLPEQSLEADNNDTQTQHSLSTKIDVPLQQIAPTKNTPPDN